MDFCPFVSLSLRPPPCEVFSALSMQGFLYKFLVAERCLIEALGPIPLFLLFCFDFDLDPADTRLKDSQPVGKVP